MRKFNFVVLVMDCIASFAFFHPCNATALYGRYNKSVFKPGKVIFNCVKHLITLIEFIVHYIR